MQSTLLHCVLLVVALAVRAECAHPFICCDYVGNKVCVVSAEGKVEWEYACPKPQDCWKLANGNYVFCYQNGAAEVTPDKKIVWEYKGPEKVEIHSCQPIAKGRTLLVECGTSRLLEIDKKGKVVKEIKLNTAPGIKVHDQFRAVRKQSNGHYLLACRGEKKIVELDAKGKRVREISVPGDPHNFVVLPKGHLLVTLGNAHKIVELDEKENIVWELNENDLPENPLRLMTGCQRLPNGNTVFCNYTAHGFMGKQPQFFEVTKDKKVVWQFRDDVQFKTINQVQLLDVPGDPSKGEILR